MGRVHTIAGDSAKAVEAPAKVEAPAEKIVETAPVASAKKVEASAVDNLTEINGIGPVIEKKLVAAGVTSFKQIAEWSDEDLAKFDVELSFKGRIEREEWVKQAKAKV